MRLSGRLVRTADSAPEPAQVTLGDGRIASIQSVPEPGPHFILPGLIDSHVHLLELGLESLMVNLAGTRSITDVLDRIHAHQSGFSTWGISLSFNLEPDCLDEQRYPTREELDRVTGSIPAIVYRVDGHSAVVNSAGLEMLGGSVPDQALRGREYELASRRFKRALRPDLVRQALACGADLAAARGVTTIGAFVGTDDLGLDDWRIYVDALAGLGVRAVPYLQTWSVETARHFGLAQVGGCLLLDGSFGSRTAALTEDYSDEPGKRGICYETDAKLTDFMRRADEQGLQTAVHAIGDRAVLQAVTCAEAARASSTLRHRVEHAELLDDALISRVAGQKLVLGMQPAFEAFWGGHERMYARRLGSRWQRTNRFRSLLDSGVVIAGGSDAPITPVDPVAGIAAAVNHPNPAERIQPAQALAMFSSAAAFALRIEGEAGEVCEGRPADLTILDQDPRSVPAARVLATYRAGRLIFGDPAA